MVSERSRRMGNKARAAEATRIAAAAVTAAATTSTVSDMETETRPVHTEQEAKELRDYEAEEPRESDWLRDVNAAEMEKIARGYPKVASTDGWADTPQSSEVRRAAFELQASLKGDADHEVFLARAGRHALAGDDAFKRWVDLHPYRSRTATSATRALAGVYLRLWSAKEALLFSTPQSKRARLADPCQTDMRVHIPVQTAVAPVQTSVPPTFPALAQNTVSGNATETPPRLTSQDLQATTFVQSALEADELMGYEADEPRSSEWLRLVRCRISAQASASPSQTSVSPMPSPSLDIH